LPEHLEIAQIKNMTPIHPIIFSTAVIGSTAEAQCLHLTASSGIMLLQNGHFLVPILNPLGFFNKKINY
jgi:hypothetical protein